MHINDQRKDAGFFLRIWLSKYFMSTIKLPVLFCSFFCARIMQCSMWTFILNLFAPYALFPLRQLFVVYKMASNVNAEIWHFFVCCCYDVVGVFHWPFYFCSLVMWPPGGVPASRRYSRPEPCETIDIYIDNFRDASLGQMLRFMLHFVPITVPKYVLKSSTKLSIMAQAVIIILYLVRSASRLKLITSSVVALSSADLVYFIK